MGLMGLRGLRGLRVRVNHVSVVPVSLGTRCTGCSVRCSKENNADASGCYMQDGAPVPGVHVLSLYLRLRLLGLRVLGLV